MSDPTSAGPVRLFHIAAAVWLLILSALVGIDHRRPKPLIESHPQSTEQARLADLATKVASLDETIARMGREPAAVSAAAYAKAARAQNTRLDQIEHALADTVTTSDLVPLEGRLTHVETEVLRLRRPRPHLPPVADRASHNLKASDSSMRAAPPFTVLGVELRGGEPFLALAPAHAHALSETQLLRPGETYEDWTLEALDRTIAVFVTSGEVRRLPIP